MSKERKHKGLKKIVLTISLALIVGLASSSAYQLYMSYVSSGNTGVISAPVISELDETLSISPTIAPTAVSVSADSATELSVSSEDLSDLVEAVIPSVVAIECSIPYVSYSFWGQPVEYESTSAGTGFFVSQSSSKLYIVTNNHVVEDASAISVTLLTGDVISAETVGTDSQYDLAVISVDLNDIPASALSQIRIASIGDSESLNVGEMAIAIGNALDYGQSTTVGYISALDREVTVDEVSRTLLQTDTAINPGNSGGPLLNIYGQVIGINSVKFSSVEVEGMGYAIPISTAVPIINELINYVELSESEMGYLGIEGKDISQSYSSGFNMPLGIYVYSIDKDSPAAASGLNVGDIIVGINGRSVTTMSELSNRISHIRCGETVTLNIKSLINGSYVDKELQVTLGKRP